MKSATVLVHSKVITANKVSCFLINFTFVLTPIAVTQDLEDGQSVSGFAGSNQWNYYTVTANSATNMLISIDQDWNNDGDCDLYVRADEQPDRFHYDYRNIGFDNSFSVTIQNPLSTQWHIGVYGYRSCQYFITETLDSGLWTWFVYLCF